MKRAIVVMTVLIAVTVVFGLWNGMVLNLQNNAPQTEYPGYEYGMGICLPCQKPFDMCISYGVWTDP